MDIYDMRPTNVGLPELVDEVYSKAGHMLSMVEIGSYAGQSMEIFASTKKVSKIICIDPWQKGYDPTDAASSTDMEEVEKLFDGRADAIKKQSIDIVKHKGTIDTFAQSEQLASIVGKIDFVYIDGKHQYDSVKHDIEMSLRHLKPRIAVCGHDWHPGWSGVQNAVLDSIGKPDKIFIDTSWIKFI